MKRRSDYEARVASGDLVMTGRSSRRAPRNPAKPERSSANPEVAQLEMVRCLHCDLHLPKSDAVTGRRGVYCSLEHRQRTES